MHKCNFIPGSLSGSLWLSLAPSGSLRLALALYCSPNLLKNPFWLTNITHWLIWPSENGPVRQARTMGAFEVKDRYACKKSGSLLWKRPIRSSPAVGCVEKWTTHSIVAQIQGIRITLRLRWTPKAVHPARATSEAGTCPSGSSHLGITLTLHWVPNWFQAKLFLWSGSWAGSLQKKLG